MITEAEIARLRGISAKGSIVPWNLDTGYEIETFGGGVATTFGDALIFRTYKACKDNAILIVEAVNVQPALLNEIEALQAKVAGLEAMQADLISVLHRSEKIMSRTVAAIDAYNKKHDVYLCGPVFFDLGRTIAAVTTILDKLGPE